MKQKVRATWVELLRRLAPLLPADLFARLRVHSSLASLSDAESRAFAGVLQEAISALDSLHHTLTNFLPRYLLELSPRPGQPHGELLEGSFIFADVTGFTTLTGELSRRGTEGQEEMNRLMRALFAALLDPLLNSGGDLLIFAGDAVLASFPARPEGQDARWAVRTALRLVEAIVPFARLETPYGTFSLTMSAGVERGSAFAAVVGTPQRMELLISGGPVWGAMRAEGEAEPGQVFAGPGVLSFLRPDEFILQGSVVEGIHGGELSDYEPSPPARRRRRLSAIVSFRIPDLVEHLERALVLVEALVPFIPPDLFTQIARGEDIRQHPPVAIQFVNVLGLEDVAFGPAGPERAAAVFQRYFVQAQEVVANREGIISQVDAYAKGFTLLNPFGAPTHHEGVPRLAASAALELDRVLEGVNREFALDPPLAQRTGLTYARIFTGEIGYQHRREYVVAGPAVNLAARLMGKAEPGQIVLDPVAWEAVKGDFLADDLPPISLKGIAEPVPRFLLQGVRKGKGLRITDLPLVGRRRERAVLETLLEEAIAGRGGALALIGESGFGKNLLAACVVDQAHRREMAVLTGRCQPFTQRTPYAPWKEMVEGWFGSDEEMAPEARRRRLQERLAEFDLTSSLPAFADLVGLPAVDLSSRVAESSAGQDGQVLDLFATLQEQQAEREEVDVQEWAILLTKRTARAGAASRPGETLPSIWEILRERAAISRALCSLLERQASRQPTLIVLEDVHWLDADSWEVLESVMEIARERAIFLLATARPRVDWGEGQVLLPWEGDRMLLPPLSEAEGRDLAARALRAVLPEPDLADWLQARARGNPLFVISYCRALRDANAVVVDAGSGEARWSGPPPSLPLSLQELLLAQVDHVGQGAREMLRRGAVIGVTFSSRLLRYLCRDALSFNQLDEALDQAARRALIVPPPLAQAYSFSSQSLHDTIYATLSHAVRQGWHEQVGDWLVQADEVTCYERLEQIAYHYSRSGDVYKAARFARLAGDKARARRADEAALGFYTQALAVSSEEGVRGEQWLAREGIGDIYALRSESEAADEAYRAALPDAPSEDELRIKAKLALLSPSVGQADPQLLEEARRALPASGPLRPWLGVALCWVHAERGEMDTAVAMCRSLLPTVGETVGALLRELLKGLDGGEPLFPFDDVLALFANSYLLYASREVNREYP